MRTPYPLPAFLIGIPASVLPLFAANALFAGCGAAALAWSLTRTRLNNPRLLVFASFAYLHAAQASQWSPLLTAAALTPGLAFVLAAKPTIGAALWIAYPSFRSASLIVSTFAVSLLVRPSWIWEWWPTLSDLTHVVAPIEFWELTADTTRTAKVGNYPKHDSLRRSRACRNPLSCTMRCRSFSS